jgi:methionyl-tRNA formyltransferase
MDTGPILMRETTPIADDDTTGTLTQRLAERGAQLLIATLRDLEAGTITPVPQPDEGATMAPKVSSEEGELDFVLPADVLWRRVRALDPSPGAYTWIGGTRVKVWRARPISGDGDAGIVVEVSNDGVDVQTSNGRLRLQAVQPEGKRRMSAAEFVRGRSVALGDLIGGRAR